MIFRSVKCEETVTGRTCWAKVHADRETRDAFVDKFQDGGEYYGKRKRYYERVTYYRMPGITYPKVQKRVNVKLGS